ncbi:MAG: translocation/assembly module TamB domain-containing protein, partial [Deltaproteobacteria bacterium]|nr:translocation/assembly module TamB domain-containing protein [Deltaproteobacteria bacterium]
MQITRKKKLKTFLILFLGVGLFLGTLTATFRSQTLFKNTWGKLFSLIPGHLDWEKFDLNFATRHISIRQLHYYLPNQSQLITLEKLEGSLSFSSLVRARAMFNYLDIHGLHIDLSVLPPRKKPTNFSKIMKSLTRRLAIERSKIQDIKIQLKNGNLTIPEVTLTYWPSVIGKDEMHLILSNISGEIAQKSIQLKLLKYDGSFSLPDMIRQVFLFRDATGTLSLQGAEFGKWQLADLTTNATFDGDVLHFKEFDFTFGKTSYQLSLDFAPFDQQIKGTLSSKGIIELEDIPIVKPRLARTYDKMSFKLDFDLVGFILKEMSGTLDLNLKGIGNQINKNSPSMNLDLSAQAEEGKFNLKKLEIQSEKTKMKGSGFVDLAEMKLDTQMSGTAFDLRTLISMFSDQEIYGYADFSGYIRGDLKNPDMHFDGKATDSGYKFMRFGQNNGTFEILNGQMSYVGRSPAGTSYSTFVDIKTHDLFKSETRRTSLKSTFENLDVSALLENPGMIGKLSGSYDMEVNQDKNSGKVTASVQDFHLYQFHIGDMKVDGNLSNGVFTFPNVSFHPPGMDVLKAPRETVFKFDPKGFNVKGSPIAGMDAEGSFLYDNNNLLKLKGSCEKCDIAPLLAVMEFPPAQGSIDGSIQMDLYIGNFNASKMDAEVTRLAVPWGEGSLTNSGKQKITFRENTYHLDQVALGYNNSSVKITGTYQSEKPLNLNLDGNLDLGFLKEFKSYVREASGASTVHLKVTGPYKDFSLNGNIQFQGSSITLRSFPNAIENIQGTLTLDQDRISSNDLRATIDEGDLKITGSLWQDQFKITKADARVELREISYADPGVLKLILSGKLALTGQSPHLLLSGNIDITEGRYIKNFDIREFIIQPSLSASSKNGEMGGLENLDLDLKIKSPGELLVKNNIAELY